jgi:hypothetical protein
MSETCGCPICLHPDAFDDVVKRHVRYHSAFWENPAAWGPKLHAMGGLSLPDSWPEPRNSKPQLSAPVKPVVIPSLPPLWQQAVNFVQDTVKHVAAGMPTVEIAEFERRLAICAACPRYLAESDRCSVCGCHLRLKATRELSVCPENRWAIDPNAIIPPCADCEPT